MSSADRRNPAAAGVDRRNPMAAHRRTSWKLAVAIAGDQARPDAFVVFRGFERSIRRAAELGFDGVELAMKSADEVEPERLAALLDATRIEVSAVSTGQVYADSGLSLTDTDPDRRARAVETLRSLVDLAARFGRRLNIGRVRGRIAGRDPAGVRTLLAESLRALADHAGPLGVQLVVEPVNRYETDFLNSVEEAAVFVRDARVPGLALMPDLFHMNIEDRDIAATLCEHATAIGYVHLADSNRRAPGQGHTDFDAAFAALRAGGYQGWFSVEILPLPDPDTAAAQAIEFLRPRMETS